MKKYFVLSFLIPLLSGSLFSQRVGGPVFIGSFSYGVQLNCSNISVAAAGKKWTRNIYENENLSLMLESLKSALMNGKLKGRSNIWDRNDTTTYTISEVAS
ncbi:MAG: hypothetical protein IAF38_17955 [Bacteroidia bacterium]|nr:hypothetical protein [Bacteroidia bacterium]